MHVRAAELFVGGFFAGRHFYERWSAEVNARLVFDHDGIVAHAGHVGTACGGGSKDEADARLSLGAASGDIAEVSTAWDKDFTLVGQISACAFDERDAGQLVIKSAGADLPNQRKV